MIELEILQAAAAGGQEEEEVGLDKRPTAQLGPLKSTKLYN